MTGTILPIAPAPHRAASLCLVPEKPGFQVGPELSPEVADVVRIIAGSADGGGDIAETRRIFTRVRRALGPQAPEIASVRDETIAGPGGPLALRLYRPSFGFRPLPALLFFHGGGWTVGDLDSHDTLCRQLAVATGHAIVAVDYRLAPEHPWPAAIEDGWAALRWLAAHAPLLAIDPLAIGVAGDSAGGNIAAILALKARDAGGPVLKTQVLIYPAVDLTASLPSHFTRSDGYLLTRQAYVGYIRNYLAGQEAQGDWQVSPLRAERLDGLPPTVIITAGFDPLLDEGRAYAGRLAAAGVPVLHRLYPDMVHGFITMGGRLPTANRAIADIGRALASYDIYAFSDGGGI
ncbi:hypothetical protein CHU95_07230 [Niveispirillum lacus]|uniref:Alpha/beta hydrolase fold-3 domain-containing protein n=1 Tax=Niveispirillum lacus TaxID=1981099 RepID=A0A255Z211_9PROT|nr:alpha/beta hydrolase [Niveispirillum lacus]OYQ35516.1 hypothetical protein CHU95_07230 [Niveispirillum lacus]